MRRFAIFGVAAAFLVSGSGGFAAGRLAPGQYPTIETTIDAAVGLGDGYSSRVVDEAPDEAGGHEYAPDEIIVKFGKTAADAIEGQLGLKKSASGLRLSRDLDDLAAKYGMKEIRPVFKDFKKHRQQMEALPRKDKRLLTKKEKHILRRLKRAPRGAKVPDLSRVYKIKLELEPGQSVEEVVAAYNADPDVEYAELNHVLWMDSTPNDPSYYLQWSLERIDGPQAWDLHTGTAETIVGVVDTGADYRHRDLQTNMWVNEPEYNGAAGVDDDGNGYVDDIYGYDFVNSDGDPIDDRGHGTHCAGIIAAQGNNGLDITGVCWDTQIMALKFLDADGRGVTTDAVAAFYYAAENGADLTSNSWGGGGYSQTMEQTIDYVYSQGLIMVAAAGNNNGDLPQYPAYYEHVVAVAATNLWDRKASFSCYGRWVDICAPGVGIWSLQSGGGLTDKSGTSMACPHVAGVCSLVLAQYPQWDNSLIAGQVVSAADDISSQEPIFVSKNLLGGGRLNAHKAMTETPGIRLIYAGYTIDDSTGDGDGSVDPEETLRLDVTIKNTWAPASSVSASISSPSPFIEIVKADASYGPVQSWEKEVALEPFVVTASPNCPLESAIPIELAIYGDGGYVKDDSFYIYPKIQWVREGLGFSGNDHPLLRRVALDRQGTLYAAEGRGIGHMAPDERDGLYRGTRDQNGNVLWQRLGTTSGFPATYSAFDCDVSGPVVYAYIGLGDFIDPGQEYVYRSTDCGSTWALVVNLGSAINAWIEKMVAHPDDPNRLYLFVDNKSSRNEQLYSSSNGGSALRLLHDFGSTFMYDFSIDSEQPSVFYACGSRNTDDVGRRTPYIYKSTDAGLSWTSQSFGQYNAQATAIDAAGNRIYVAFENAGVCSSDDGGQTWIVSNKGLETFTGHNYYTDAPDIWDIHIDLQDSRIAYLSIRGKGQYKSYDGGQAWQPINFGPFPTSGISIVQEQLAPQRVCVADFYSGVRSYNPKRPVDRDIHPDINLDLHVDSFDYCILAAYWCQSNEPCDANWLPGDITKNHCVDANDLKILVDSWLDCYVGTASPVIPHYNVTGADLNLMLVWNRGYGASSHDVYLGTDANAVAQADHLSGEFMGTVSEANFGPYTLKFGTKYYWRIDEVGLRCTQLGVVWMFTTDDGKASDPDPANGQTSVSLDKVLSWTAGLHASLHDVYLGTDYNDVNDADTTHPHVYIGQQLDNSWDPCGLAYSTVYFWRIDESGPFGPVKGDTWSFTTGGEPNFHLVGWWQFDEGAGDITYDSAGDNDGTLMGDPNWVAGLIGAYALEFDGADDYVEVSADSSLNVQHITMSAWVQVRGPGANNHILNRKMTNPGTYLLWVRASDNKLGAQIRLQGSETTSRIVRSNNAVVGEWMHVCGTYDGDKLKLYIDSIPQDDVDDTNGTIDTDNPGVLTIGAHPTPTAYFDGSIDDARIYNRALSAAEVEQLYQQ